MYWASIQLVMLARFTTYNASSTTKLIELFEKTRYDVSYICVTFHPSDGIILLTVKDITKRLLELRKNINLPPKCNVKSIWDDSKLGSEGRLLAILMYSSKEELRLLRMHPETCAVDTTFGTHMNKKDFHCGRKRCK